MPYSLAGLTREGSRGRAGQDAVEINDEIYDQAVLFNSRITTRTQNGAALVLPSTYPHGEAIELRYASELSNTQFQGIFLHVQTDVANTSTIRAAEFVAKRGAAVAVGTLEGINSAAYLRVAGGGNVTNAFGLTGELQTGSTYTGTVTAAAAVRGKLQLEDGATYTVVDVFRADLEAVTGAGVARSLLGVGTLGGGVSVGRIIDATGLTITLVDTDKVGLIRFRDTAGNTRELRVTDAGVVTAPTI